MSSQSLKKKLLLWIMPLITVGFLTIIAGAYWYINDVIKVELSRSMLNSVDRSAESINQWLQTIMLEPEIVATTPAAKNINNDFAALDLQNINRHKFLRAKYPDIFQDIYAANRKGEYHTVQQHGDTYTLFVGDIANRPYFLSIMAGGPTQITPPLISRTTGIPTIFMVSPILDDNNKPQGLIGAGLSLSYIQKIARELKAGTSGYGLLIAQDGTYIYHPNSYYILHNSISELDDANGHKLGEKMLSGGSGSHRYMEHGREMIAFYHPIPIAGWSVATVLPTSELFAPANRMIRVLTVITFIFMGIISLTIYISTGKLTAPLEELAARARAIAAGNLELGEMTTTSNDEIGMVADAFNVMHKNLAETLSGLRQSEDKYRSIFENATEGIVQTTLEGEVLSANPACARMLGLAPDTELVSQYNDIERQLYVNPEERANLIQALSEHGEIRDFEAQFYRPNGDIIWVSINASLIRDAAGTPKHIEGIISDITEKKKAEEEREHLQLQLAQAQKLEAVGQLAGGVAHDFNNMLAVILGLTELALLKSSPEDKFRKTFVEIQKAAEHSADLTRQLLAFARKQPVTPRVVALNQVIDSTLNILRRLIGEDIELRTFTEDNLWKVKIDPAQIGQILTNLCVNSRDAISGVGEIVITTANVILGSEDCQDISDAEPGEYVLLSVQDNGQGMDESTKSRIFEPFFTTRGNAKGTGLGLATVYGIAKQNNACIDIHSIPGKGTTVKIYLPHYQENGVEDISPQSAASTIPRGQETILVVEDEPELLNIAQQMLEGLGYTVLASSEPDEAIQLAKEHGAALDILMTDVIMPKMNGKELFERIRVDHPGIICLFMSGYTADVIATRGVLEEGVNFIEKPFSLAALSRKIRALADSSALSRKRR